MRLLALLPLLFSTVALILTFLCLFAGSKPGFMEDYAIITLNTSRFGEDAVNLTSSSSNSSNVVQSLINDLTNAISQEINDGLNYLARDVGLLDFYSLHILDFCEGYYEPSPLPNATLPRSSIYQNITRCSNRTALLDWDPKQQLQDSLNRSGYGWLNVTALKWPDEIDDGVSSVRSAFKATFILYCIAIGFMFLAFVLAIVAMFMTGRVIAILNIVVDTMAFLTMTIASALVTVVMQQGSQKINKYGDDVGIEAYGSSKLLAITWVATAVMFLASIVWCFVCIRGRKDKGVPSRGWRSRRGPRGDKSQVKY